MSFAISSHSVSKGNDVHDARRTLISLAQADGARRDILRWITHGPEGDIVSDYDSGAP